MSLTPQIDNQFEIQQTEKLIPSKTYKLMHSINTTQKILGEPISIEGNSLKIDDVGELKSKLRICGKSKQVINGASPSPEFPSEIENVEGNIEVKVTNGLNITDVDYQEQTVYFPLAEGQKLMEGSYLTEDGVHNVREQIIIDGSKDINYSNFEGLFWIGISVLGINYKSIYGLCNYFSNVPDISITDNAKANTVLKDGEFAFRNGDTKDRIYFKHMASGTDKNNFQIWLQANPITVEYELAEEETVPYTATQQRAWDKLQNINLYSPQTNIISNHDLATLELTYYPVSSIDFKTEYLDRIIGYTDNLDAVKQAAYHILHTERNAHLIYDADYGVELEQYKGKDLDYIKATIDKVLKDALTHDLRITDVSVNMIYPISNDIVWVDITIHSIYGDLIMEVDINV